MDFLEKSHSDLIALPKLKKHFIFSTVLLLVLIVMGQSYQDYHRRQELYDAKQLQNYHQQAQLTANLIHQVLSMKDANSVAINSAAAEVMEVSKQLMSSESTLKLNFQKLQRDDSKSGLDIADVDTQHILEEERVLSYYVSEILLTTNEILALAESNAIDSIAISKLYKQMLLNQRLYNNKSGRLLEKLSDKLQANSNKNRVIVWLIVGFILILVVAAGVIFYKVISGLVNRQFILIRDDNEERKKNVQAMSEQAQLLLEKRMKMQSILDSTVDSIITITEGGLVDSFNKTAELMFGYSAAEVIGQNVKLLMPENYAKEHDGYLKSYKDTGIRKIIGIGREVTGQRKDLSQFPIYLSVSEVAESKPKLFTGILSDMTERKKLDVQLKEALEELRYKQVQLEHEEQIARHVFEKITASNNDNLPELSSWIVPMGTFSGDMMLSAVLPSGTTRVLLCDFTGHGLPAALGAVPVSSIHKAMAQKDLPLEILMDELNNKLRALLPTGIFCCIAGVDIDATRTHAHIWNAGLPEVLLVNKTGEIIKRIKSDHLPLGVVTYDCSEMHCVDVALQRGDSIYLYSDGMTEAENPAGEMFGQQRFEELLMVATEDGERMNNIQNSVRGYINNAPANDDLSLLQIKTLVMADEIILES
jgi:PAS domain S-box-containing protein